jgi:hypothetical protein
MTARIAHSSDPEKRTILWACHWCADIHPYHQWRWEHTVHQADAGDLDGRGMGTFGR